jgi:methanogenic corrinoid protein MtbC1
MYKKLEKAISDIKEQEALTIVGDLLNSGADPIAIMNSSTVGMDKVGKLFETGDYFLPELIMAGEILKQISEMVKPKLTGIVSSQKKGKVLIGTVEGDIHDIGKDIVVFLLDVNGFDVHDIGIDASPAKFVEEIRIFKPSVVGMSGLLTIAYESMRNTVAAIKEAGLRNDVKIMLGGGQMTNNICTFAGADAYGKDAVAGVNLVKNWLEGK